MFCNFNDVEENDVQWNIKYGCEDKEPRTVNKIWNNRERCKVTLEAVKSRTDNAENEISDEGFFEKFSKSE